LLIDKKNDMEATTIRELYIQKVREYDRKIADKEIKNERKIAQEEARMRQEEARMRQEEARMRQEEARMRQEAEQRLAILVRKLHKQGESVENIAETMGQPIAFVQDIIDEK
jgi:hypothetical protein